MVRPLFIGVLSLILVGCGDKAKKTEIARFPEELRWVAQDADVISVLTIEPAECLNADALITNIDDLVLGRLAFRSPYLLGGQATRRGLSCNSCHTNGDVNRHFFIEGLSGSPGSADVTSFHFSKSLGDQVFNPKPIPSLAALDPAANETELADRKAFILRLVKEEFEGQHPSNFVSAALVTYVEALDANNCRVDTWQNGDLLEHQLKTIEDGLAFLSNELAKEGADADFIISALRNELGRLRDRYPHATNLESGLKEMSAILKTATPENSPQAFRQWEGIKTDLRNNIDQSYYSPNYIRDNWGSD